MNNEKNGRKIEIIEPSQEEPERNSQNHSGEDLLSTELDSSVLELKHRHKTSINKATEYGKKTVSYEEEREKLKYGKWKSVFFFWSSVDSIVIFTVHHPLSKVGVALGLFLNGVITVLTLYGVQLFNYVATKVEEERGDNKRVTSIQDLCDRIGGTRSKIAKVILTVCFMGIMTSSSISNIILTASRLSELLGISELVIKLLIFSIVSFLLFKIAEPEKIEWVFYLSIYAIIFLEIMIFFDNIIKIYQKGSSSFQGLWNVDVKEIGSFSGMVAYAYEMADFYLAMRLTSKRTVNYRKVTNITYFSVMMTFFLIPTTSVMAYNGEEIKESAFDFYPSTRWFFASFVHIYLLTSLFTFLSNAIFCSEIIVDIPSLKPMFLDKEGKTSRKSLVILRISVWSVCVLITLFTNRFAIVLDFAGSIFTPFCSYFVPVWLYYIYKEKRNKKITKKTKIKNIVYVGLCLIVSYFGFEYTIKNLQ